MAAPIINFIEIRWNNGHVERATGDDAADIMAYYNGMASFGLTHGIKYTGPKLQVINEGKDHEPGPSGC